MLREEHRSPITEHLGRAAGNGQRVLERLYERPIISVAEVRSFIGTTYAAANQLVHKLVEHGILKELTGQKRNRRFVYDAYIRLFSEPAPGLAATEGDMIRDLKPYPADEDSGVPWLGEVPEGWEVRRLKRAEMRVARRQPTKNQRAVPICLPRSVH